MAHTCFEGERVQMKFRITENVSGQDVEEIQEVLTQRVMQRQRIRRRTAIRRQQTRWQN